MLITTRPIDGRMTGRKRVLRTILSSLSSLQHEVVLVEFYSRNMEHTNISVNSTAKKSVKIAMPRFDIVLFNIFWFFISGRLSLNECLYYSKSIKRSLKRLAEKEQVSVIITDMIRLAPYGVELSLPWIADLDDLLSKRYLFQLNNRKLAEKPEMILGYMNEGIPKIFRKIVARIAQKLLSWEVYVIKRREDYIANIASSVTLVSREESNELTERTGRPVSWMPMAIDIPQKLSNHKKFDAFVFTGGLDYQPNLDALIYFQKKIRPLLLNNKNLAEMQLHVIGFCPPFVANSGTFSNVIFRGYVDSLTTELVRYPVFIAPIISGTGIKTKILEAMACGVPVVTTVEGVKGLGVKNRVHCFIANSRPRYFWLNNSHFFGQSIISKVIVLLP
jgi:glycosyltransferase involved in cell wall biosynthesis